MRNRNLLCCQLFDWVCVCMNFVWLFLSFVCSNFDVVYVSLFHSLIVLSFSSAADAMIFSVGWHAVQRTTSVWPCKRWTTSLLCKFQMYTMLSSLPDTIHWIKNRKLNYHWYREAKLYKNRIFNATYLATGDGEIGKDAILFIFMAGVCFQAFTLWIVPQF